MISPYQIHKVTMTPEKRSSEKNSYFDYYIVRPLSYFLTIPFLYTKISPNQVSVLSILPVIFGFLFFCFSDCKFGLLIGFFFFFLWDLLDAVDGNIARYKKQYTRLGSVYDAMSGYLAMYFAFFSVGIASSNNIGFLDYFNIIPKDSYTVIGALSGLFSIFPRLVMHKTMSSLGTSCDVNFVKDKSNYGLIRVFLLNLISVSGFVQVLMLVAIIFDTMDVFSLFYFFLNFVVMLISICSIMKKNS